MHVECHMPPQHHCWAALQLHLPGCTDVDLYPDHLRHEIDQLNDKV
jgi:hypothetical protein